MEEEKRHSDCYMMKRPGFPLSEQTKKILEKILDKTKKKIEQLKEDEEEDEKCDY